MTEPVRLAIDTIRSLLAPLEEADRNEVMIALAIVESEKLAEVSKQLDEARETTESWRVHNEQRMEQVEEARRILGATPDETLMMAVRRKVVLSEVKHEDHCDLSYNECSCAASRCSECGTYLETTEERIARICPKCSR